MNETSTIDDDDDQSESRGSSEAGMVEKKAKKEKNRDLEESRGGSRWKEVQARNFEKALR